MTPNSPPPAIHGTSTAQVVQAGNPVQVTLTPPTQK